MDKKCGNHDHGGRWSNLTKELAVDAAYGFPVLDAGEVHSRSDDIVEGCAAIEQCLLNDFQDAAGLYGSVSGFGAYRAGACDVNCVSHADGAGEADDGFKWGCAADVLAHGDPEEKRRGLSVHGAVCFRDLFGPGSR